MTKLKRAVDQPMESPGPRSRRSPVGEVGAVRPRQNNGNGSGSGSGHGRAPWTFLTNHSHVLICLWRHPEARLRDVAEWVGITERAVQAIVADLEAGGVLTRMREGRRNHYVIHDQVPLRHPVEARRNVAALLAMVGIAGGVEAPARRPEAVA